MLDDRQRSSRTLIALGWFLSQIRAAGKPVFANGAHPHDPACHRHARCGRQVDTFRARVEESGNSKPPCFGRLRPGLRIANRLRLYQWKRRPPSAGRSFLRLDAHFQHRRQFGKKKNFRDATVVGPYVIRMRFL